MRPRRRSVVRPRFDPRDARPGAPVGAVPLVLALLAVPACGLPGQTTDRPFPDPIRAGDTTVVGVEVFAIVPDSDGEAARMMRLVNEPGTGRLFVNDMRGPIHVLPYGGGDAALYLDIDDPRWGVGVHSRGRERGFQSFALHPDFGREGTPGYGRLYTWTDVEDTDPPADFVPGGGGDSHDTVLLEWVAGDPSAPSYDGGPPRELMRFEQPYGNHNAGHLAFHPLAAPGDPEYGMLYVGVADGGSGGDPLDLAQDRSSAFGKILRIDPLGSDAGDGAYGIPSDNPFVGEAGTLPEIWALGLRNPQRFGWDPATGAMYVADIGQNTVEEVSPVTAGANLGWNEWEGSFRFVGRQGVDPENPRSDASMTYPVAEWSHGDPLLLSRTAATGIVVVRGDAVPALRDRVLFGDFPSGEIFHFDADEPPEGGNQGFGRVLLRQDGEVRTFLEIVRAAAEADGREPPERTDLRFARGPGEAILLLNKHDGTIRRLVP